MTQRPKIEPGAIAADHFDGRAINPRTDRHDAHNGTPILAQRGRQLDLRCGVNVDVLSAQGKNFRQCSANPGLTGYVYVLRNSYVLAAFGYLEWPILVNVRIPMIVGAFLMRANAGAREIRHVY